MTIRLEDVPGIQRDANGGVVLKGPVASLFLQLDGDLRAIGQSLGATPMIVPSILPAVELRRIDYFTSFPHLICLPASPRADADTLEAFRRANGADGEGPLVVEAFDELRAVLAPAACYGVYPALRDMKLADAGEVFDVRATCFRREAFFESLRRLGTFTMREAVYVGTMDGAQAHLENGRARVLALADHYGLSVAVEAATDPFFDPARSKRYAHQKLFPSKFEICVGEMAIGSLNLHRNFFGEAYRITCGDVPASTACVAYGIERWLAAVLDAHGPDPRNWPGAA